jgi:diacylglycerol kinase (ATP)
VNTKQKTLIILNPAARSDRAQAQRDTIAAVAEGAEIQITSAPGDARSLARQAVRDGFSSIVAAGGDGTVNEVANGLAGSAAAFGILPVGTMNVFATELGIPQNDLAAAWAVIAAGHRREIDLPKAGDEYFVQLAGAGLDAEVVQRTTPDSKRVLGPMSYLITLAQVAARKPPIISVDPVDGPPREGSFVLVGNGRLYGGPFVLFQDASLEDGLLDVLVFKNQSHWDLLRYVQAIAFGNHPELPDVEYFQTCGLRLMSREYVPVEVDGELTGALPCEIGFSSQKLHVLAPAHAGREG